MRKNLVRKAITQPKKAKKYPSKKPPKKRPGRYKRLTTGPRWQGWRRSDYVVYIDGVEKARTRHRYGNTRHRRNVMDEAHDAMRDNPDGKVCQIVKHPPVDASRDEVLYTFRRRGKKWLIALKHKETAA